MGVLGIKEVIAVDGTVQIWTVDEAGQTHSLSLTLAEAGMMLTQIQAARRVALGQTAEPLPESMLPMRNLEFLGDRQSVRVMRVHITSHHYQDFAALTSSDLGEFIRAMSLVWSGQKR